MVTLLHLRRKGHAAVAQDLSLSLPLLTLHLCGGFRTLISPPTVYSEKVASAHPLKLFPSISY